METRIIVPHWLILKASSSSVISSNPPSPSSSSSSTSSLQEPSSSQQEGIASPSFGEGETTTTCGESEICRRTRSPILPPSSSKEDSRRRKKRKKTSSLYSLFAKVPLPQGTTFVGVEVEGEVETHYLDHLPPIESTDIRLLFGCVDRSLPHPHSTVGVRLLNWLRFLKNSPTPNILGRYRKGHLQFQVLRDVGEGEEMGATYDLASLAQLHLGEGPLDLSTSLVQLLPSTRGGRGEEESTPPKAPKPHLFSPTAVYKVAETGGKSEGGRTILRTRGRERSLLPCEVCGKAFDRPSLLKRHMRTHTGEKPHVCDVCSKGFSTSSSLNTHRRIHSGEKPHQCPVCGKRFTASSNLYYHRMTHNKEKPHKCALCGKSFPTPGDLKSHQYVHSGCWPYNCPICHRGFSKQTNLRNHLLLHSGDKPHPCNLCGKKFALACNLRAHLRTHEEEPAALCELCKRSFLPSLNMLVEGVCRPCLLSSKSQEKRLKSPPPPSLHHTLLPRGGGTSHYLPLPPTSTTTNTSSSSSSSGNPFLEQLFQWNYRFAKETAGSLGLMQMQQQLFESQILAAQLVMGGAGSRGANGGLAEIIRATNSGINPALRPPMERPPLPRTMDHPLLFNPSDPIFYPMIDLHKFIQQQQQHQ